MSPSRQKRSSLSRIAVACGTSVATVSNVLRGKGRFSDEMRERVLRAAQELDYVPNRAGRALRTGRSELIGLVVPDITYPYFPRLARALKAETGRLGYGLLLVDATILAPGQGPSIGSLERSGVDGMIVVPSRGVAEIRSTLPLVVIDAVTRPGNTVASDHRGGARAVADHLRQLGHREVLILGGDSRSYVHAERQRGLREGFEPECVPRLVETADLHETEGVAAVVLAAVAEGVTAVLAVTDHMALVAMTALQRAGLRVPEDVSVAGYDDLDWAALVLPALTTVRQDADQIARLAVSELKRRIDVPASAPPEFPPVPVQFLARASTGPVSPASRSSIRQEGPSQ